MTFGSIDAALFKTGMKEDFSGDLSHVALNKMRISMDKDM
jgi:hypothetical protein